MFIVICMFVFCCMKWVLFMICLVLLCRVVVVFRGVVGCVLFVFVRFRVNSLSSVVLCIIFGFLCIVCGKLCCFGCW